MIKILIILVAAVALGAVIYFPGRWVSGVATRWADRAMPGTERHDYRWDLVVLGLLVATVMAFIVCCLLLVALWRVLPS